MALAHCLKTAFAIQGVRNFGVMAPSAQKATDPIQQLFVDKIREYSQKKEKSGGKLVDATAATDAELKNELEKVAKAYGGGQGVDMAAFPNLKFVDPTIEPIDVA